MPHSILRVTVPLTFCVFSHLYLPLSSHRLEICFQQKCNSNNGSRIFYCKNFCNSKMVSHTHRSNTHICYRMQPHLRVHQSSSWHLTFSPSRLPAKLPGRLLSQRTSIRELKKLSSGDYLLIHPKNQKC